MNTLFSWLNATGPVFCRHAFWMLIQTGILFGILWCLDRLLRRFVKATFRYALWLLILVKLLLPADLALPSGIGYWFRLPADKTAMVADYVPAFESATATETAPAVTTPPSRPQTVASTEFASKEQPAQQAAASSTQPPARLSLTGALFGLWLLGAAVLAAAIVYQILYVGRIRARSCPVPGAVQDMLTDCQTTIGLRRRIGIKQSDAVPSPAVCGLWRPTVLMPSSLIDTLDTAKLRAVLLHELGHIQRHDLWVNMIQTILQLFYFYNPFVRLANHWIRRTREQANDEHVLLHLDGRRQDYSATLLDIAAGALARPALAMRMIGVAEPKTQLHERITLIMKKPLPKTTKAGLMDMAALLALALVLLPMAAGPNAVAEEMTADVKPLTREQKLAQVERTLETQLTAFNAGNLDDFLSPYADDALVLPDEAMPAIGRLGLQMFYKPQLGNAIKVLEYGYMDFETWSCGRYVITATYDKVLVRIPSESYLATVFRNYLTVFEVQPDRTMKIKIQAGNDAGIPGESKVAQPIQTAAAANFHVVETKPITVDALNQQLETVKQLDIKFHECFNHHEQERASTYYANQAILMTVGKAPIHGAEAITKYIIEGSQGMQHINNNQQIIHAEGNDQMVIIVNQFGWVFKILETGKTQTIPGKGIHVWQKQPDGQWKILLDIHNTNIPLS